MARPATEARFGGGVSIRGGGKVVGDYIFGRQIGTGSFSSVWHARHRTRGTEVAVKDINMERLSRKLQDSLLSEIVILKKINHPNIIALYDIIEYPQRIYLVLEYCRGGDLSMYIQRHGRVPEATAKHFMQQLATGLQVLRENDIIHRDLKPQNLLLSSFDDNSALKIADFGFARSLQPRGLAETLCGSPLYMAPEIMQLQKYDAKADLWSVGAILFQLVTGKTPFTGNNQIQLLQNIVKSNELCFPPNNDLSPDCIDLCQKLLRRNPVERLTFEEFFNHQFLSKSPSDLSMRSCHISSKTSDSFPLVECSRMPEESSQEDCLPFALDDESIEQGGSPLPMKNSSFQSTGQEGSQSAVMKSSSMRSTYGFSLGSNVNKVTACSPSNNVETASRYSSTHKLENTCSRLDRGRHLAGNLREIQSSVDQRPMGVSSKDPTITDSLEFIDQDYVLVSGPLLEVSSSSVSATQPRNSPCKSESSPFASPKNCALSAPIKITGAAISNTCGLGSLGSLTSPPSGTSQGSVEMGDAMEQPSTNCLTRIRSLQQCASVITELVNEKIEIGEQLEAFSIQLVLLAIWKQALHSCHAQVASAIEGSPSQEIRARGISKLLKYSPNSEEYLSTAQSRLSDAICSQIERDFFLEVGHAEELARNIGLVDDLTEMPDAMEVIYDSARALGRKGAADELMNNMESAENLYSKAVHLLYFLLVEASSLILNPPFSLTNSDRNRLRSYIDKLNHRQTQSRSQRMALNYGDQQSPCRLLLCIVVPLMCSFHVKIHLFVQLFFVHGFPFDEFGAALCFGKHPNQ